jgi:hypothetical protein
MKKQDIMLKSKFLFPLILFIAFSFQGISQLKYSGKIESGLQLFQSNTIDVDPGPEWKGYYNPGFDILDLHVINGLHFGDSFYSGMGISYQRLESFDGVAFYVDLEYLPFDSKITPLINIKAGYNHLWNQYEGGTGTEMLEASIGLNFSTSENRSLFTKIGTALMQQSILIPFRIGFRF